MKTIIAATDFSKEAENAVAYAAALVQQMGGKLILFNVYTPSIHVSNARPSPQALDESATQVRNQLAGQAASISDQYAIAVSTYTSVLGDIRDEIDQVFLKYHADLLVMGMAARSIEQDLLGNTTTSLIYQFKYPVLAIPYGTTFKGIDRILFACDNLQGVQRAILEEIKALALGMKASVEIFHVNNRIREIRIEEVGKDTLVKFGEGLDGVVYYYKDVQSNTVIKAIADELTQSNADLLVMLPAQYGFWASLIHRSKTRVMASGLSVPLLSIPLALARQQQ